MLIRNRAMFLGAMMTTLGLAHGCAPEETGSDTPFVDRSKTSIAPLTDSLEAMGRGPALGTIADNGLEVQRWLTQDSAALIGRAMTDLAEPVPLDDRLQRALAANGMRFHRIPARDLPALKEAVGGASREEQISYGQVFDWRELWTRSLNAATRGVAIDGRVRSLPGGQLSILLRAWTMKTEDGPRVHLDLVPYYLDSDRNLRLALNADPVPGLMSQRQDLGEVFTSLVMRLRLEDGYAYILTCESPAVDWTRAGELADSAPRPFPSPGEGSRGGAVRGDIGPADFGPEMSGPATLGELLMRGDEQTPLRLMLVLVPHIPSALYPPEAASGE